MQNKKSSIQLTLICFATVLLISALVFIVYDNIKIGESYQNAQNMANLQITSGVASLLLHGQDSAVSLLENRATESDHKNESQSNLNINGNSDDASSCADCLDRFAAFLADPSQDDDAKVSLAKTLLQPETKKKTVLLVQAITNAHVLEQEDLKDRLLQLLADVHTTESASALMSIISGEVHDLDFHQMPEDLQYAIQKSIRLNPDHETVGRLLAESYSKQGSPEISEDFQQIQHSMMTSLLIKEAYDRGDIQRVELLTGFLTTANDPRTLEGLMFLSREETVPLDEAVSIAYAWANSHRRPFDHDCYEIYLNDSNADAAQRSIAAFALAASQDANSALASLEKALHYERDSLVCSYIESAMSLLANSTDR